MSDIRVISGTMSLRSGNKWWDQCAAVVIVVWRWCDRWADVVISGGTTWNHGNNTESGEILRSGNSGEICSLYQYIVLPLFKVLKQLF